MQKIFLSTTSLDDLDSKGKICFLGEWCMLFKNRAVYEKLDYEVCDYIWKDKSAIDKAFCYCFQAYDRVLPKISNALNKYHDINMPTAYWNKLLLPWLISYIQVMFDRYSHIKQAYTNYNNLYTNTISDNDYSFIDIPLTFYKNISCDDYYNLQLYSQIVKWLSLDNFEVVSKRDNPASKISLKSASFSSRILTILTSFINLIFSDRRVLVVSPYFKHNKIWNFLLLFIKSKFSVVFDSMQYKFFIDKNPALGDRIEIFSNIKADDEFESLLYNTLIYNFPIIYLEAYKNFNNFVLDLNIKLPNIIFSANSLEYNEIYKFYIANNYHKFIVAYMQHGGGYGIDKINICEEIEYKFSDIFFTFGWRREDSRVMPTPLINQSNKLSYGITLVMAALPRFFHRFGYFVESSRMVEYIENTKIFLSECIYYQDITVRLYSCDYQWSIKDRLLEIGKNIKFDNSTNYYKQIKNSKLNIFDHMHTGYMESMQCNKPTVIFISDSVYCFRQNVLPYIQLLEDANILFFDAKEVAEFVNKNYENIDEWWNSSVVQKAKDEFCKNFARASDDWADEWIREFNIVLEEQCKSRV